MKELVFGSALQGQEFAFSEILTGCEGWPNFGPQTATVPIFPDKICSELKTLYSDQTRFTNKYSEFLFESAKGNQLDKLMSAEPKSRSKSSFSVQEQENVAAPGNLPIEVWFEHDPSPRWIVSFKQEIIASNNAARAVLAAGDFLNVQAGLLAAVSTDDAKRLKQAVFDAISSASSVIVLQGKKTTRPVILSARLFGAGLPGGPYWALCLNEAKDMFTAAAIENALDFYKLTPAEKATVAALFDAAATDETAKQLGISHHTVNAHLRKIFAKLNCNSKADVILKVMRALTEGPALLWETEPPPVDVK